jgi:hypothetical protein
VVAKCRMSADARFQANLQKLFASVVKGGTLRVRLDGTQHASSTPKMLTRLASLHTTWRTQYVFVDNKQVGHVFNSYLYSRSCGVWDINNRALSKRKKSTHRDIVGNTNTHTQVHLRGVRV